MDIEQNNPDPNLEHELLRALIKHRNPEWTQEQMEAEFNRQIECPDEGKPKLIPTNDFLIDNTSFGKMLPGVE
jgi:hypothetical protein